MPTGAALMTSSTAGCCSAVRSNAFGGVVIVSFCRARVVLQDERRLEHGDICVAHLRRIAAVVEENKSDGAREVVLSDE